MTTIIRLESIFIRARDKEELQEAFGQLYRYVEQLYDERTSQTPLPDTMQESLTISKAGFPHRDRVSAEPGLGPMTELPPNYRQLPPITA